VRGKREWGRKKEEEEEEEEDDDEEGNLALGRLGREWGRYNDERRDVYGRQAISRPLSPAVDDVEGWKDGIGLQYTFIISLVD
jgi:hypothetical protein